EGVTSTAVITIRDKEKNPAPNNDNNKGQDSHNTREKVLPQTGEQTNTIWTLAGFLTVLLSLIYFVKKRKKSY
ncbi:LPXTG cell wall anchor domain-containing protein, partial [Enterococcus faecalis]|nr:LPXTG cell wall anchor domain-containing protein [Enterococcus faecalis]